MSETTDLFSAAGARERADAKSFIEVQLPISKLSKECYKERKAGAGQTLTGLGGYWKGRKPLILVRAVVLGLLLPVSDDPDRDRAIFLKLMLMDEAGLLKRRKPFNGQMASRVADLLPESSWSRAISRVAGDYSWIRRVAPSERQAVEVEAFLAMGLDAHDSPHFIRPVRKRLRTAAAPAACGRSAASADPATPRAWWA